MDLQTPQDKLEDDVMSAPEKDVSLNIIFSYLHQLSMKPPLSSAYTMLLVLDDDSRFIEPYYLANYEISCPQHLKVNIPFMKNSFDELKRLIEDLKDKRFGGAGKKRILGPYELENPGYMSLKMKNICALSGEFGSYGNEDWTEREGEEPLLFVGERFVTPKNGVRCITKITFTDNSRWLRSRRFRLGAKVVQPTSNGENIKEGTSEPFVVEAYKKHCSPFLNDEIWHLMKIAKEGQIHKRPSPKGIHTVKDLLQLLMIDVSSLYEKELSRKESLCTLEEYPQNHCKALNKSKLLPYVNKEKQKNITVNKLSMDNNRPCVVLNIDLMEPSQRHGNKMTSQLQDNSTGCNLNKHTHKKTMPRDLLFQHKRKEIAQHVSFVAILSIMFLGLFSDMWIQPLHRERGPVSIWPPLLGLFGFMVFVWAVAITILVGVPFSRMQSSVLIFWAILMHLKSASSISAVLVPMLGIIFLGVFARRKV